MTCYNGSHVYVAEYFAVYRDIEYDLMTPDTLAIFNSLP